MSPKIICFALAAVLAGALASCGKNVPASVDKTNPHITFMCAKPDREPIDSESPVWKAVEEYIGAKIDVSWIPRENYDEKMTATLGAGNFPMVMLAYENSSGITENARAGTFWEIGGKIKDETAYPNLSAQDTAISDYLAIDGKNYALYRRRDTALGYDGFFVFPKKALQKDEDIDFVLKAMDKMNDAACLNLINYGIEGRQYTKADNTAKLTNDADLLREGKGLFEICTNVGTPSLLPAAN